MPLAYPLPIYPDLFGDVPVSLDEIEFWLDTVPRLPKDSPRRAWYAQNWDVIGKIKTAKKAGNFPPC